MTKSNNVMKKAMLYIFNWLRSLVFMTLAIPIAIVAALAIAVGLFGILIAILAFFLLFLAGIVRVDWQILAKELKKSVR